MMIRVTGTIALEDGDIKERFVRASGPGGQNVNKEATAVELRVDTRKSSLPPVMKERLIALGGRRVTTDRVLVVDSRVHRSQEQNRHAARARLLALLQRAARPHKTCKRSVWRRIAGWLARCAEGVRMPQSRIVIAGVLVGMALVSAWDQRAAGQQTGRTPSPLVIPSLYGGDLYRFYCASCHGREGKGDGPVASALNRLPADLTTIAKRNGGRFPADRVERFVSGDREPTVAHGPAEMPVWGPIFQALDPRDALNRIRIANVVAFIESMQSK